MKSDDVEAGRKKRGERARRIPIPPDMLREIQETRKIRHTNINVEAIVESIMNRPKPPPAKVHKKMHNRHMTLNGRPMEFSDDHEEHNWLWDLLEETLLDEFFLILFGIALLGRPLAKEDPLYRYDIFRRLVKKFHPIAFFSPFW